MLPATIKKRRSFLEISKTGSCYRTRSVLVICKKIETDDLLIGFTASKKVGNAVLRNFARRRLRHLVSEFCSDLGQGFAFVFIATRKTSSLPFCQLRSDFITAFKQARKFEESHVN